MRDAQISLLELHYILHITYYATSHTDTGAYIIFDTQDNIIYMSGLWKSRAVIKSRTFQRILIVASIRKSKRIQNSRTVIDLIVKYSLLFMSKNLSLRFEACKYSAGYSLVGPMRYGCCD